MSLLERVKIVVSAKPNLAPLIAELKNASIPLEERWESFTLLVNSNLFVNDSNYYGDSQTDDLVSVSGSHYTLYDDFNCDRYVTKTFVDMYDNMLDKIKWNDKMAPTPESLRDWQERILQNGYTSVTNDW